MTPLDRADKFAREREHGKLYQLRRNRALRERYPDRNYGPLNWTYEEIAPGVLRCPVAQSDVSHPPQKDVVIRLGWRVSSR